MSATTSVDGAATVLQNLQAWAAQPFSENQDLVQWFLWTGLIIVMVLAWIWILHEADELA